MALTNAVKQIAEILGEWKRLRKLRKKPTATDAIKKDVCKRHKALRQSLDAFSDKDLADTRKHFKIKSIWDLVNK